MYLAKLRTRRMMLTKFGETWEAIEAKSAIKIQCAFRKRMAIKVVSRLRLEMVKESSLWVPGKVARQGHFYTVFCER